MGISMKHIAFAVEQAYGHILPTLGIAMELIRRGHRVSYAVTHDFAPGIIRVGARALVFSPMVTRPALLGSIADGDRKGIEELRRAKTENSLGQLERLFCEDKPDLIIHDACEDFAGRLLALRWGVPHIRFSPVPLESADEGELVSALAEDSVILVSVPRFFSERVPEILSARMKVIGFIHEGRNKFFEPWKPTNDGRKVILISVTTGILPQVDFCRIAINAFHNEPYRVVLSIGGLDRVSKIRPADLGALPENIELNQASSNFDILQCASLFITQGGQGSVLEALYCGVPILGIPSYFWDEDACRKVAELGLGARLAYADASPNSLREHASTLLEDYDTLARVKVAQQLMREDRGAEVAANIIDAYL
jgi:demethyllactenocin mycarosyltransferase